MDEVTIVTGGLLISKVRLMEEDNEVRPLEKKIAGNCDFLLFVFGFL